MVTGTAVPRATYGTAAPYRYGYGYNYGGHYPYYSYGYRPYYYPYYRPYYYPYYAPFSFGLSYGYPYYGCCGGWSFSFGIGFGYPGAWYYNPWYGGYPYGPYGAPYAYGGYIDGHTADVRIEAKPVDADVYVDGNMAGRVDDFDGTFQRLHLEPGDHQIVLYRDGYHTVSQTLYVNARSTRTIKLAMEPLAPGEIAERPPDPPAERVPNDRVQMAPREPQGQAPQAPRSYREQRPAEPPHTIEVAPSRFGTLSLKVLPGDSEILIDGERWSVTGSDPRIAIQLGPGRHKLEIHKQGYEGYTEEIGIREGGTLTLNVLLRKN